MLGPWHAQIFFDLARLARSRSLSLLAAFRLLFQTELSARRTIRETTFDGCKVSSSEVTLSRLLGDCFLRRGCQATMLSARHSAFVREKLDSGNASRKHDHVYLSHDYEWSRKGPNARCRPPLSPPSPTLHSQPLMLTMTLASPV